MKTRRKIAGVAALALGLCMGGPAFAADEAEELDFGNVSGDGMNGYSVQKYNQAGLSTTCINAIKKVRQDALDTDIKWPSRTGDMTITQYLAQENISTEDYLNPSWSNALEHIAMERAAEQSLHGYPFFFRVNGDWNSLSITRPPTITGIDMPERSAMLAWNYETSCGATVREMSKEKSGWAGEDKLPNQALNYRSMVDPKMVSYGFAQIEDTHKFGNTQNTTNLWMASVSSQVDPDTSGTELVGPYTVHVKVHPEILDRVTITPTEIPQFLEVDPRVSDRNEPFFKDKLYLRGTWSSGDESIATVTADNQIHGVAPGTVEMTFTTDTGETKPVTFTVTATTVKSVTNPAGVTTESGTAPILPATVTGTVESGGAEKPAELDVTWDAVDPASYSMREGGTFTVNGTVDGWAEPVTIEVTVNPAVISAVTPEVIEVTTESGKAPNLPANVDATWSNGDTSSEAVTWDDVAEADYSAREGGAFTVAGAVAGWEKGVTANVTVTPATKVSVLPEEPVETPAKIAPVLPDSVFVKWSNGDTSVEAVTWDPVSADQYATAPASFTVNGTVDGIADPVTIEVNVVPPEITAIEYNSNMTVPSGSEQPDLPTAVEITWENGEVTQGEVTWDSYDASLLKAREGGEIVVDGHLDGYSGALTFTITVEPATVASVDPIAETSTFVGKAPTLAEKAMVTWSNGDTSEETIAWNEVAASAYAEAGEFTATGMVGDAEVTQKVVVLAVTADSVAPLEGVTTEVGTAPVLAEKAMVTWSNGETTEEPITWDEISADHYAEPGEFVATGKVAGLDITQSVTVSEAKAPAPSPDPTDPGKDQSQADPKKPHDGKKYGNSLPHTGADIALLGLVSFLLIGAGTELTRRYVRSR